MMTNITCYDDDHNVLRFPQVQQARLTKASHALFAECRPNDKRRELKQDFIPFVNEDAFPVWATAELATIEVVPSIIIH